MSKKKSVPSGYGAKDSMGRLTIQGVYSELKARVDELRLRIEHGLHQVEADHLADKHQRELTQLEIDNINRGAIFKHPRETAPEDWLKMRVNDLRDDFEGWKKEVSKVMENERAEHMRNMIALWNRCRFWLVVLGFFSLFCVTVIGVCAWFMWMAYTNVGSGGQVTILFP